LNEDESKPEKENHRIDHKRLRVVSYRLRFPWAVKFKDETDEFKDEN